MSKVFYILFVHFNHAVCLISSETTYSIITTTYFDVKSELSNFLYSYTKCRKCYQFEYENCFLFSPGAAVKGYQELMRQVNKIVFEKSHANKICNI